MICLEGSATVQHADYTKRDPVENHFTVKAKTNVAGRHCRRCLYSVLVF